MNARIPADVDMPDRIFFGLTFRQIGIAGIDALVVWALFVLLRDAAATWVLGVVCGPIAVIGLTFVLARPAGITPERFIVYALRHLLSPKRFAASEKSVEAEGPQAKNRGWGKTADCSCSCSTTGKPVAIKKGRSTRQAPPRLFEVDEKGRVDLGSDGTAAICRASCLNFALRSDAEKKVLTAGFARLLNSLDGPTQFLIHSEPADAKTLIAALERQASVLPNPALATAAFSYADFLRSVTSQRDVLASSVFVCLRDRRSDPARRLDRRVEEISSMVRELGVAMDRLEGTQAMRLLQRTCDQSILGASKDRVDDAHGLRDGAGSVVGIDGVSSHKSIGANQARLGEALC